MPATCCGSHRPSLLSSLVAILMVATLGLGFAAPAKGQEASDRQRREFQVFSVTQEDLNGDGKPDLTIIDCSFITDHDRVLVYDRGGDMRVSDLWEEATDFENDLWVFDAAADGYVELIIDFRRTEQGLVASLWDDQDGDGTVRYAAPPRLSIPESNTPNVRVVAPDGWWTRGGKTNFNLDIVVDGRVQASFMARQWLHRVGTDGRPDYTMQVRDTDGDGRPDYQWVDAWIGAPADDAIRRTEIAVSPSDDEPPIKGAIFWPFLGSSLDWDRLREDRPSRFSTDRLDIVQERSGYTKYYSISPPPIQMLWNKGVLLYVGEFVASRFNDDNWFVYSIARVHADTSSPVNFEAPFAFYDLSEDDDGYPELSIRFEQYLARDRFPFRGKNPEPMQIVRYSWDQDNDTTWDYKLGLIGRNRITDTLSVGDLTLQTIPPARLPDWVTQRPWDGATFVVAESWEKWTSEGIYDWDPTGRWRDLYVTGLSTEPPSVGELSELEDGLRGEYAFDLHRQPRLYVSSVDGKLHLLGAQGGVWKVDDTREIKYANLGGDYLNQWTLLESGIPTEKIHFASDHLVYENPSGVQIRRSELPPALMVVSPPTTNEDRMALERLLLPHRRESAPWDFEALVAPLGDPWTQIEAARMLDFRLTRQGFRFVMELDPGFRVKGVDHLDLSLAAPGAYAVSYDGSFHVRRATPAELSISMRQAPSSEARAGVPISILTQVTNLGLVDAKDLSLVVRARQGEVDLEVTRQRIEVLAGVPARIAVVWEAPAPGKWDLEAELVGPTGQRVGTGSRTSIDVAPQGTPPSQVLVLTVGGGPQLLPLSATLLLFAAAVVAVLRLLPRAPGSRSVDPQEVRTNEAEDQP